MCNNLYNAHLDTQCLNDPAIIGNDDTALRFSVASSCETPVILLFAAGYQTGVNK